jgi:hypothetical protein
MADRYHMVKIGGFGSTFIEVNPEKLDGVRFVRLVPTIGPSALSMRLTPQEALELIGCIADVAGLDEISDVCADLGFEPT